LFPFLIALVARVLRLRTEMTIRIFSKSRHAAKYRYVPILANRLILCLLVKSTCCGIFCANLIRRTKSYCLFLKRSVWNAGCLFHQALGLKC